jgi:hypothetical protein
MTMRGSWAGEKSVAGEDAMVSLSSGFRGESLVCPEG